MGKLIYSGKDRPNLYVSSIFNILAPASDFTFDVKRFCVKTIQPHEDGMNFVERTEFGLLRNKYMENI